MDIQVLLVALSGTTKRNPYFLEEVDIGIENNDARDSRGQSRPSEVACVGVLAVCMGEGPKK